MATSGLSTTDIAVLCGCVVALILACAVAVLAIYCGYCGRCRAGDRRNVSRRQPPRRQQGAFPVAFPNMDIDTRPPAPLIDDMVDIIEEDHMNDMGMVYCEGQALRDLPGLDYEIIEVDKPRKVGGGKRNGEDDEVAPPVSPRIKDHWLTLQEHLLKPSPAVEIVTCADADHAEDHYSQIRGSFRYLAPKRVTVQEEIGQGAFGTVSKGLWKNDSGDDVVVAVKTLKEGTESHFGEKKFLAEGRLMGRFDHDNVLKLYGAVIYSNVIMLVLEYLEGGCLQNFLYRIRPETPVKGDSELATKLLGIARDVACGLAFLAEQTFVHRDIAARNILIGSDTTAKIGDFGMSRLLADEDYYMSHGGKLPYKWCPPEVINYRKYSLSSDVWSFGVLLHEVWTFGRKPYFPWDNDTVMKKVNGGYRLHAPPGCSRKIYFLMIQCWHPDRRKRPTAASLQQTLSADSSALLQLDGPELRKIAGLSDDAYKLGADPEHTAQMYSEIRSKYAHMNHDVSPFTEGEG